MYAIDMVVFDIYCLYGSNTGFERKIQYHEKTDNTNIELCIKF